MANYLSCLIQILLLVCGPLAVLGCAVYVLRTLFTYLVGHESIGRRMLVLALAPSTPVRVLGGAAMAILFGHTIDDICFLNVRDPDGELGFVENSYHPFNPVAQLGKLFLALVPALLSAFAVFLVFLLCFGNVMPDFMREVMDISYAQGGFGAYAGAVGRMMGAMFAASGWRLVLRLFGAVLIVALSMGAFVSVSELVGAIFGSMIFGGMGVLFTAFLMLFDTRAQRLFISGLHAYAAVLSGVYAVILAAALLLVLLGALLFLVRTLTDRTRERARVTFEESEEEQGKKQAPKKKEKKTERKPVKRVHPDGFTVYEYDVVEETPVEETPDAEKSETDKTSEP